MKLFEGEADKSSGGGGTGRRQLDPNGQECKDLARRISNIAADLAKRLIEYETNPLGLPEQAPGSDRNSREGHRKIIEQYKDNLTDKVNLYTDKCGGPPPPVSDTNPVPRTGPIILSPEYIRNLLISSIGIAITACVANPIACGILVLP